VERGREDRSTGSTLRDLQQLLAEGVQRLRRSTGCRMAVAWALRENGEPYVAAADFTGDAPGAPDAGIFALLAALRGATQLDAEDSPPALREVARRTRCQAAVPVGAGSGPPLAALLLAGEIRPRVLAELDAAALRLDAPLAAALAAGRLQRIDAEVQRLDRLAALGALSAEIAHEIRNPLVSLQTFLGLLPERREEPEFLTRYLDVVMGELRRVNRLLDLLVDCARPAPTPPGPEGSAPEQVLDTLAELLRHRAAAGGVRLEVETQDAPRTALGEDALRQVLLNLALNAIDATPPGGSVRLFARAVDASVEIRVIDSGPGIPDSERRLVFEPFSTTRGDRPGGLGLAITRRIVEEAAGRIEIADAEGGGAELVIRVPAIR
jgi:signal transduction histidine kinase